MKMVGNMFALDGSLIPIEMYGPPGIQKWHDSADVMGVLIIMFDVMDFQTWTEYTEKQPE